MRKRLSFLLIGLLASLGEAAPSPAGNDIFVTLTRGAMDAGALPSDATRVTPDQFQVYDAQNAGDAVARETSVQILSHGGIASLQTASIRGSTSEQTLVMVDGRPYSGFALGSADLSEIPVEQIDHIEIVRGGVSALYGPNAMGGVINIITKRASTATGVNVDANYDIGSFGRQAYRMSFGSHAGPLSYQLFGDKQWESGFRDNADDRQHHLGGNAGISFGDAGKLLVDLSSYRTNAGVPGQLIPSIPWNQFNNQAEKQAATPFARQDTATDYARASYLLPLPAESLLTLRLFGQQREVQYDDPTFMSDSDRHEQSKGGEVQLNLPQGFLVGGNFLRDREDNTDLLEPGNSFIHAVENWGVFAQDTFRTGNLTLIPSGRYDHNSAFGETKNPRVEAIDDVTDSLRFSASGGRSFRAPTIDDLYFRSDFFNGNPDLRPETAWTYDVGFELHQASESLKVTGFRSDVRNLIQADPITFATEFNIANARRQGVEAELAQVVNSWFNHRLNYTYLSNRGVPAGFTHDVVLAYSPKNTLNYTATVQPFTGLSLESVFRYRSSRFSGNDEAGTKLGATFIWDVRLAYDLRWLEAYVGLTDVTNKRYEDAAGFPLPGRAYYGGLRVHFNVHAGAGGGAAR